MFKTRTLGLEICRLHQDFSWNFEKESSTFQASISSNFIHFADIFYSSQSIRSTANTFNRCAFAKPFWGNTQSRDKGPGTETWFLRDRDLQDRESQRPDSRKASRLHWEHLTQILNALCYTSTLHTKANCFVARYERLIPASVCLWLWQDWLGRHNHLCTTAPLCPGTSKHRPQQNKVLHTDGVLSCKLCKRKWEGSFV